MKKRSDWFRIFFSPRPFHSPQFTLRGAGLHEQMRPGWINRTAGTGDWLFMHFYDPVTTGGMAGAEPRELPEGGLVIWAPGEWQYYGNEKKGYLHSWFHCDGSLVRQNLEAAGLHSGVWPDAGALIEPLVADLREEAERPGPDPLLAMACFSLFVRKLARLCATETHVPPPNLQRLKRALDDQPQEAFTLDEMAKIACLSRSHLCVQFRAWFGRPPLDYLIEQRMVQAQYLLHDRNLRIGEIARRLGYDDVFYFSKLFKRRTGVCPEAFRQRITADSRA